MHSFLTQHAPFLNVVALPKTGKARQPISFEPRKPQNW